MPYFRFSGIVTAFCLLLLFLNLPFSAGQDIPAAEITPARESIAEPDAIAPFTIRLSVDEVRLDVVVVDKKGKPITDLTADDFKVFQDRLPQEVTSGIYIVNQSDAAARPAVSKKDSLYLPQIPGATLKEEDVSRTILFVVDNLSMGYEHLHYAKMGIKRFVERQMQPGDMAAIMRTGYGNSALNMFLTDKRQINARADSIPYQGLEGSCYGNFAPTIYDNQLSTLFYSIRAMKDMPGRKIVFFMTSCPLIQSPNDNFTTNGGFTPESQRNKNYYEMFGEQFNRLADEALRASVVVHSLDTKGLQVYPHQDDVKAARNPLPVKTGGIEVENNFFLDGIGKEANNMISGYYLISYVPPPKTFDINRKDIYHRVKVEVKRKGAVVHTRDGFYGRTENETDSDALPAHPLYNAILSPFKHADLNVNMAAGYVKNDKAGYLVRSWIHVDPSDLTMVETEDGGARIDLETLCLTSDISGRVHDFSRIKHTFDNIKPENIAWVQKHGIRFSMLLPVKKPGYYSVHIAVQDTESGKVGSAYQSVEIPDLGKKGLALSNIFMITSAEDLLWMRSDETEEIAEGVFFPMFQENEVRSPALRTYTPGDKLQTLAILYNADVKAIARSEIETQSVMYKDGKEFMRNEPTPIDSNGVKNPDDIPFLQKLTIGMDMTPGDYVLQLLVIDKKNDKKEKGVASQALGFTIAE